MKNRETKTDDKVNEIDSPVEMPVNFLVTAHQATSLLRKFVTANFSTNGPPGYEFQTRTLYTPEQLFAWLRREADRVKVAIRIESAVAERIHYEPIQHDQNDDDGE